MVPEYTGTATQGFGCGARTARSVSVRARARRVNWLVQAGALGAVTNGGRGGSAAAGEMVQEAALATAQATTGEGRRLCDRKAKPHPLFISQMRQPKSLLRCIAKILAMLASPGIQIVNIKMKINIILTK